MGDAAQMSDGSFEKSVSFHMISTILLWYQAEPDTINHFVLALNMVSLVAVAMMTLQYTTVVLQHKVLCEQGNETER